MQKMDFSEIFTMDWKLLELIGRLALAGILGGVIGFDRSYRAKEAGLRTHFLVALGSALIMIVSQHGFGDFVFAGADSTVKLDPSRIAAQIVSGIGFLGAGMIIFQKKFVSGLTTAAGLWTAAGIGMAVGGGMYAVSIAATLLTLFGLELLRRCARSWITVENLKISCSLKNRDELAGILTELHRLGVRVLDYQHNEEDQVLKVQVFIRCNLQAVKEGKIVEIFRSAGDFHLENQE